MRRRRSNPAFAALLAPLPVAILLLASEALAAIPPLLRATIESALADGDGAEIAAVVKHARRASPENAAAIQRLMDERAQANASSIDAVSLQGRGELGGSFATGESEYSGLSAGLALELDVDEWRHNAIAQLDYQESLGATTRNRHLFSYQPHHQFGERLYSYGLGQYERDRALGYASRYTLSTGVGYRLDVGEGVELGVEAGPAYRVTELTDGRSGRAVAGRGLLALDSKIGPALSFNQAVAVYVDSLNSTINATSALSTKLFGRLSARLTYNVQFESDPPDGKKNVDTLGRASLAYEF